MSGMFLASSLKDVANIFEEFARDFEGKTVTFIPTAGVVEKVNFFVKSGKRLSKKWAWSLMNWKYQRPRVKI